jgi:hypothetical protein
MGENVGIFAAGLIGLAVAYVELLARYRDDPRRAVWSWPAFAYALINGAIAALGAWWLVTFSPATVSKAPAGAPVSVDEVKLAIVAGFGSMAVLRTSLLKLRMNSGDDISVGPAVILDQLLSVVDRAVDRHLAEHRAQIASELAGRIDFDLHRTSLVSLCLVLLQNPSPNEQQQMTSVSQALAGRTDIPSSTKSVCLLLALLGLVGETVLREAVKQVAAQGAGARGAAPPALPAVSLSPPAP